MVGGRRTEGFEWKENLSLSKAYLSTRKKFKKGVTRGMLEEGGMETGFGGWGCDSIKLQLH